jgi:hypothetical protein
MLQQDFMLDPESNGRLKGKMNYVLDFWNRPFGEKERKQVRQTKMNRWDLSRNTKLYGDCVFVSCAVFLFQFVLYLYPCVASI